MSEKQQNESAAVDGIDPDDEIVEGETPPNEEQIPSISYDVTSYGSDPEVEGLVNRIRRGDVIVPSFQRDYVWRQPEASKFIESLLLGLPVPGIFLATDPETSKQLVIDGQQRLKTLQFFYDGYFNPKEGDRTKRIFTLTKVQSAYDAKTYATLEDADRIRLDTSIIHATIIKQSSPPGDDTSLYHIFERLNRGGRRLTDQEMRIALYHGSLIDRVKKLNEFEPWRKIFGKPHSRLKDQELILRFFALFEDRSVYERPMSEFVNKFAGRNINAGEQHLDRLSRLFEETITLFNESLDVRPFRLVRALNVAVFDSCMVGLATRVADTSVDAIDRNAFASAYKALIEDPDYVDAVSRSTGDEPVVNKRVNKAIKSFADC